MNFLHSTLFCVIVFSSFNLAYAEDNEKNVIQDEEIDLTLLEFLGEWETDEGEWIAPEELEDSAYDVVAQNDTVTIDAK